MPGLAYKIRVAPPEARKNSRVLVFETPFSRLISKTDFKIVISTIDSRLSVSQR